ncbi:MAG: PTS sugar transporter subunit IIA [Chloroflexota bacterium]
MVGILIVTHGKMASGLLNAVEMIIGKHENVAALELTEQDQVEAFKQRIEQALDGVQGEDGAIVFVDMLGATPFNLSARVALERDDVEVITGVNLPLLLEIIMQREHTPFEQLVAMAQEVGADSIKILSQSLAAQDDES